MPTNFLAKIFSFILRLKKIGKNFGRVFGSPRTKFWSEEFLVVFLVFGRVFGSPPNEFWSEEILVGRIGRPSF